MIMMMMKTVSTSLFTLFSQVFQYVGYKLKNDGDKKDFNLYGFKISVIMLALGSCHPACKREAMYLRSLEVFIIIVIIIITTIIIVLFIAAAGHFHHNPFTHQSPLASS